MANKKVAMGRRGFLQALAIGAVVTVGAGAEQLGPTTPSAPSGIATAAGSPATTPSGKVPLTGVDCA